jgi:hypothetical protein
MKESIEYLSVRKDLATSPRIRIIVGIASLGFLLAVFDWRFALVKQPESSMIHFETANKRIRDALKSSVIGITVNESDILHKMGPFDLPRLNQILGCDEFSVESLLKSLNGSSPNECEKVLTKVFDSEAIPSTDETLLTMERFYAMVKAPGGLCQLEERLMCEQYDTTSDGDILMKDPKIAIMVIAAGVQDTAGMLSLENKEQYASMHGYDLHVLREAPAGFSRDRPWLKIPYMASLLHKYDYVWSLDLDTLILDMSFDVRRLIDDRFDLIVGIDMNGINTGSFLMRKSSWSSLLMYTWWLEDNVEPLGWWEQAALHKMSQNALIGNHIKRIKQEAFNSYEGHIRMNPATLPFVLHFPGDADKWSKIVRYAEILKNSTL